MKHILAIICLLSSTLSYSQLNVTLDEVQTTFGSHNIVESATDENHFEVKKLSETESIKFTYNTQAIVVMIEVKSKQYQ